jgi:hypothetical protein
LLQLLLAVIGGETLLHIMHGACADAAKVS